MLIGDLLTFYDNSLPYESSSRNSVDSLLLALNTEAVAASSQILGRATIGEKSNVFRKILPPTAFCIQARQQPPGQKLRGQTFKKWFSKNDHIFKKYFSHTDSVGFVEQSKKNQRKNQWKNYTYRILDYT